MHTMILAHLQEISVDLFNKICGGACHATGKTYPAVACDNIPKRQPIAE